MADQTDVETELVNRIAATLYPSGALAPSTLGGVVRIYRGWPLPGALDADLQAGTVNITVHSDGSRQRDTTRFFPAPFVTAPVTPGLAIDVTDNRATVSGHAGLGQVIGLRVDGQVVVHRTQEGDSPALVAAILCAYLSRSRIALVSDTTITVPGAYLIQGHVAADQVQTTELRRQRQGFRISLWCPDPVLRDSAGAQVDAALAAITFLTLSDGSSARLRWRGSLLFDHNQNARLYRRDLLYDADFATTTTSSLPAMVFGVTGLSTAATTSSTLILG